MPNWNQVLVELKKESEAGPQDRLRRKYLAKLYKKTGRNIIAYYSGWLQRQELARTNLTAINDNEAQRGQTLTLT